MNVIFCGCGLLEGEKGDFAMDINGYRQWRIAAKFAKNMGVYLLTIFVMLFAYSCSSTAIAQEEGICAQVRIQLSQDAVIARNVFKATLEITNAPQNVPLENLKVTLSITDGNGTEQNILFGINPPELSGVGDVNGGGVIQPGTTASASWLIVPTRDAAPEVPLSYYVGGEFSYTQAGSTITMPLFPAPILVKPDPLLVLDYFWVKDVYGDDPFTPEIEPAEPFPLGLMIRNNGKGVANNFGIISAQPQIVENEKGLLVDFKIIGTQVNTEPVSPSLSVNLGNIDRGTISVAKWIMTSSLQGTFKDYKADFVHIDGLGNPRLSLIDTVNIHELTHAVRADVPSDDNKPDFLVNDVADDDHMPDTLYNSTGPIEPVGIGQNPSVDWQVVDSHIEAHLTATVPTGWIYIRVSDPGQDQFRLTRVVRSDGREISMDDNAWTTHRTIRLVGQPPYREHLLHLFDKDSTGAYTLIYEILDSDIDGMPDYWEMAHGLNPNDPSDADGDADNDGLTNQQEFLLDTDPRNQDTDGDRYTDGEEVNAGSNPLDRNNIPNQAPVADAGPDQNAITGQDVTLNGSGSYDPGRAIITFLWSFEAVPEGSRVTNTSLSDIISTKPTFIPDVDGTYRLKLIVNNGSLDSAPDEVDIIAATLNVAPNAIAGPDKNVLIDETVSLDGSASNDPDNGPEPLSYIWSFDFVPDNSSLTNNDITDRDKANASFIPDVEGTYMLRLTVSDGENISEDLVQIKASAVFIPPNANAGADIIMFMDDTVVLDGSASNDPDNGPQPLNYSWRFVAVPTGSQLNNDSISDVNTVTPSFIPDIGGSYVLELTVSDGFAIDYDNVAVTCISNHPPEVEDLSATTDEDTLLGVTLTGSDLDGDTLTFSVVDGPTNGSLSGDAPNLTYTPNLNFHGSDSFTYMANDGIEDSAIATVSITIKEVNDPPVCSDDNATTDEDIPVTINVISNDSAGPLDEDQTLTVESVTHGVNGTVVINIDGSVTYTPNQDYNGSDSFTYIVSDSGGQANTGTVIITVNPVNDPPVVSIDLSSQTVQYSDTIVPVTITATDIDSLSLTASAVLLTGLSLNSQGCVNNIGLTSCTWTIEGQAMVNSASVTITVSDGDLDGTTNTSFSVIPENAHVAFYSDNPVSVKAAPGGNSDIFSLIVKVWEVDNPLDFPGNINFAEVDVSLVPVGPGITVAPDLCIKTGYGTGYDSVLEVICNFSNVAVNTYTLQVGVYGDFYEGSGEDVIVVYDPSLGFATGGGWFYWPGTENPETDYPGDKTNFGFTMKYKKISTNLQGNLLLIRHMPDGSIYRIKSNALYGLSIGSSFDAYGPFGWASFSGKSTYLEPWWLEPIGNHEFIVYVEDRNEPGTGTDGFWIEVRDKDGNLVSGMSLAAPATNNAEQLNGGNIVVPHR